MLSYTIKVYRCSKSMRSYMNAGSPATVTQLQNENEEGKFASLTIWKHCDTTVSQTTCGRWSLKIQAAP